jgi:hypothetical protein
MIAIAVCAVVLAALKEAYSDLLVLAIPFAFVLQDVKKGGSGHLGGFLGGLLVRVGLLITLFLAITGIDGFLVGLFTFVVVATLRAIALFQGHLNSRTEQSAVTNADSDPARVIEKTSGGPEAGGESPDWTDS